MSFDAMTTSPVESMNSYIKMVWVLIRIQIQGELEDHFVIYMNSYVT
jgi:hypothetical protein